MSPCTSTKQRLQINPVSVKSGCANMGRGKKGATTHLTELHTLRSGGLLEIGQRDGMRRAWIVWPAFVTVAIRLGLAVRFKSFSGYCEGEGEARMEKVLIVRLAVQPRRLSRAHIFS